MLDTQAAWFPAPQPSSFLQPGVTLSGTQLVSRRNRIREDWNVTVEIEEVDWARGYVAGRMTASQVPQAKAPITTFWEGEIVGCGGYRFHSAQGKWNATATDDVSHWIKFGGFQRLHRIWKQRHVRAPPAAAAPPPPPEDGDDGGEAGLEPMDTDGTEDATAATAELLLEVEQLDAGWSPLPTERPGGGDTDAERDAADAAAEADREAIEAMVAADREAMEAMAAAIRDRDRAGGATSALAAGAGPAGAADSAWGSPSSSPSPGRSPARRGLAAGTTRRDGGAGSERASSRAAEAAAEAAAQEASDHEGEEQQHIFMRWKEQFFCGKPAEECGLTIAGFYYVQLRRSDGDVTAYYRDPHSAPYQRLDLSVKREALGRSSAAYEFR